MELGNSCSVEVAVLVSCGERGNDPRGKALDQSGFLTSPMAMSFGATTERRKSGIQTAEMIFRDEGIVGFVLDLILLHIDLISA